MTKKTASGQFQRLPVEKQYAKELRALKKADSGDKPAGWNLSPRAVRTFILGNRDEKIGGVEITEKIFGNRVVVERSIVTLAGQRGLILVGEPGTAKSMLSELLSAAISGTSQFTVQGGAGVVEEQILYTWNYALLLKEGPGLKALAPGPLYLAMTRGKMMRFEEITRCPTEIQDSLISILSDRVLHIPELEEGQGAVLSKKGFNIIATANLKDRGVNEMSSALKRRFNFETMRPLSDRVMETELVTREVNRQLSEEGIDQPAPPDVIELLVTVFQELRNGRTMGAKIENLSSILSTAEAVQVAFSAAAECWYMNRTSLLPAYLLKHLSGAVIKDDDDDRQRVKDYLHFVGLKRTDRRWRELLAGKEWL